MFQCIRDFFNKIFLKEIRRSSEVCAGHIYTDWKLVTKHSTGDKYFEYEGQKVAIRYKRDRDGSVDKTRASVKEYTEEVRSTWAALIGNKYWVQITKVKEKRSCKKEGCSSTELTYNPSRFRAFHQDELICDVTTWEKLEEKLIKHDLKGD